MSDPTYALGHSSEEHQRLLEQAAFLRPLTERFFRAAGIRPGMRVLDLGSGVGDVALLVAEMIGPEGEVVGVDVDVEALVKARRRVDALGATNIRFLDGDVRHADTGGGFDAIVGRLILLYFADPAEILKLAASHGRQGAILAFQEMDMVVAPRSYPSADSLWSATGDAIIDTFAAAGVRVRVGRELIDVFLRAGLPMPSLLEEAKAGGGPDFPGYAWIAHTMRNLAPLAQRLGVASAKNLDLDMLAERIREDVVSRNLMVWSPSYVGAYALKP